MRGQELVPVERMVVDYRPALESYLRARQKNGTLLTPIAQIKALPMRNDPGRLWFRVTVLEPAPKRTLRDRMRDAERDHPVAVPVGKALAFGLAISLLFLGVVLLVIQVVTHALSSLMLTSGGGAVLVMGIIAVLVFVRRPKSGGHSGHSGKGWHYTDCK